MRYFKAVVGALCLAGLAGGVLSSAGSSRDLTAAGAVPTGDAARLVIRHSALGCHDWALGQGELKATRSITIYAGQSFTVENRDNCGHELVQTNGPAKVAMASVDGGAASSVLEPLRPGLRVTLDAVGTYRFKTAERDQLSYYDESNLSRMFGFAKLGSSGSDNTLTLVVRVTPEANLGPGAAAVW